MSPMIFLCLIEYLSKKIGTKFKKTIYMRSIECDFRNFEPQQGRPCGPLRTP